MRTQLAQQDMLKYRRLVEKCSQPLIFVLCVLLDSGVQWRAVGEAHQQRTDRLGQIGVAAQVLGLNRIGDPVRGQKLLARSGFRGRIAIHPDQVDVINAAFTPSEAELAHARRVIDAFAAQPDAGTVALDGVMLDIPHLKQARATLGLAP